MDGMNEGCTARERGRGDGLRVVPLRAEMAGEREVLMDDKRMMYLPLEAGYSSLAKLYYAGKICMIGTNGLTNKAY